MKAYFVTLRTAILIFVQARIMCTNLTKKSTVNGLLK